MAHLVAALPNHAMMEVVRAGREACFTVDTRIEGGYIVIGTTPGLGLEFDEERLARLEVESLSPGVKLAGWGRRRGAGLFVVPPDEPDDLHPRSSSETTTSLADHVLMTAPVSYATLGLGIALGGTTRPAGRVSRRGARSPRSNGG